MKRASDPAQLITGLAGGKTLLLAAGFIVVLLAVTRWVWRRSLRRYSGASA